jgi:hypothetical protein
MDCSCSKLPRVFYLEKGGDRFQKDLEEIDARDWMRLFACRRCGTLWAIDEWDKYSKQVASRLESREDWPSPVPDEMRKELLLEACGGTTGETCRWRGCGKPCVKGRAICIDHLYES